MENLDSFARLASGISDNERLNILNQMQASVEHHDAESILPIETADESDQEPFSVQIKRESFLTRFILWIKSIITNTTQELLYNEYKLSLISRNIEKNYPGLIDSKRGLLLATFYEKLSELKNCATFFRLYTNSIEENEGDFYVFMGSLVIPELNSEMSADIDPYANPVTTEVRPELRLSLLRKMEEHFNNIHTSDRQKMYDAVKSVEWLRQFEKLPFMRFLSLFSSVTEDIHTCPLSSLDSEINQFSKILCNGFKITDELLESLYLFSVKKTSALNKDDNSGVAFMTKAHSSISLIHMFMNSVPMNSLGKIIHADAHWIPDAFTGGEDWFVKYKNAWKKIFEQKWNAYAKDCHKEALKVNLKSVFNLDEFPLLPARPWSQIWGGIPFKYELTAGFLSWFMHDNFPLHELNLKTVLVEGSFINKENQVAFTDDFNNFIQLSIAFQNLNRNLEKGGEIGMLFSKLQDEHLRTLQGQTKVEKTVRGIESDITTLIHKFGDSCRSMSMILGGILGIKKDSRYDSLSNLNRLYGKDNQQFITSLTNAKTSLDTALFLIQELEMIDAQKR